MLVAGALTLALLVPTTAAASATAPGPRNARAAETVPGDLLPDLRLHKLYGVTLRSTNDGRKRLRFGTRGFNVGDGPLEVRGRLPENGEMTELVQWIADDAGGPGRTIAPNGDVSMFWSGDGHAHWHVTQFINVELYKLGNLAATRRIRKIGFCLIDLVQSTNPPPNAPPERGYPVDACGKSPTARGIKMGISVGYADDYQPLIAHQWIDVTTLPRGVYRLCAKINPLDHWLESDTSNNFHWHDVFINPATSKMSIQGSGRTPCGSYASPGG
jgi:hypothetical protein